MLGKKLFSSGLVLGLVVFIGFPAHADILKNFKTDGSIEVQSFAIDNELDRNGTVDDYRGETNSRIMLGGSFDLLDDVHSRLMVDRTPRQGTGTSSLQNVENTLFMDNAYVKVDKLMGHVDLTIGRQFYGDSNDLNIYFGPQGDDLLSVTSVDLFRADADILGFAKFQGIAGKLVDTAGPNISGAPTRGTDTDQDVWGGELSTDKVVPLGTLAIAYYTLQTKTTKVAPATGNNTLQVASARAGGDIVAGLGYDAEYLQDFGRNNTGVGPATNPNPAYHGNAFFLGAHYGHALDGRPFRAHLEYGRGSADFAAIAPGRRFGLIWGEYTNFAADPSVVNRANGPGAGLSNLKVFDGGVGINPIEKFGVDVNAYRFMYDRALASGNSSVGTEYDLILSWKHSENVTLEVNAATFQVGDALQNTAPGTATSPITRLGSDVKIKF